VEPEPDISPTHIGGFRVLRRLSSGATTDVLLARAEGPHGFERVVALKVLLQQFQSDPTFERMFAREASAYARLSHPAIVKLYDFFSTDGQLVMVLEYVDGLPLHKLRAMLSIGGERFEDSAALFIGSRIFAALGAAHSARDPENGEFAPVIHRDINPSNVLVPWDGHVKISDFGIAKIGGKQSDTRLGFVKGTYGYMAPEQVRGENVTVRADVYAASLVLWELLARRKAIQRGALPEVEVLKAMARPEFPSLDTLRPDVPAEVRAAIRRGLEPNPDRRSITADEMAGVLRLSMSGDEGRATLADAIARVRPPPSEAGLAVTKAHPSYSDASAGKSHSDLKETLRADPDETCRVSTDDIPEDSGAFKRSEMAVDTAVLEGIEDPPKSYGDLTVVEARRPATSDAPPTLPPSSEPGTLSPETLPLPHVEPAAGDWREPAQGFVRTSPVPEQPQTLRFGPSEPPPATAPEPSPVVAPPPISIPLPFSPETTLTSFPSTPAPLHAPDPSPTLSSPLSAPPPSVPRPAPSTPRPAALPKPVALPAPTPPPEPPLPQFPMPSAQAVQAPALVPEARPLPAPPAPPVAAPAPVVPPAAVTSPSIAAGRPTVHTGPKSSGMGLILAVVLGSALLGVGGVKLFFWLETPAEQVSPQATSSAPAVVGTATGKGTGTGTGAATAGDKPSASPKPAATPSQAAAPPSVANPAASSPATQAAPAPVPVPVPDPTARPAGSDPAAAAAGTGTILTKASAAGHRIFVDDRVVGNSPDPVDVRCGPHNVRIGSAGTPRDVEIPCGGSIVVNP
jgi:eukaryotic-like serine/threonine-protein kinase